MNLRRACLAALILAPWLAVVGALVVAYGLLVQHGRWQTVVGCAAIVAAVEVSTRAYKLLKIWPALSRAEVVRQLTEQGLGPPFGA